MPDVKQPQDRKPKKTTVKVDGPVVVADRDTDTVTMTVGGSVFESRELHGVFTPKWFRLNRRRDELDAMYTMVEDAFDGVDGFLDAWDSLSLPEQNDHFDALQKAIGATLGESSRSST